MQDVSKDLTPVIIKNTKRRLGELGWSQRELCRRMECKDSVISRFLSGGSPPTVAYVQKLASILGVSFVWMVTEPEELPFEELSDESPDLERVGKS